MTGMRLTLSWSRRINSMSMSLSLYHHSSDSRSGSRGLDLRVPGSLDKVEAGVDAVVDDLLTVDAVFLLEIRVVTRLDVLENRPPAMAI
jgi:hypothetical protein